MRQLLKQFTMHSFSQNNEDRFVLNYFGNYIGILLDIGANDGITFSNSRLLIENGWKAALVEPGKPFDKLLKLYADNEQVHLYNFAIGEKNATVKFYESGAHVPGGEDKGLVSTMDFEETKRWPDVEFAETTIRVRNWAYFYGAMGTPKFDFISIDAEGYDEMILRQIDLEEVGCQVLCIEYNGDGDLLEKYKDYCHGYQLAAMNGENLIFCK